MIRFIGRPQIDWLSLLQNKKLMETIFSLCLFTAIYGLLILSIFPDKYVRKVSREHTLKNGPAFLKYAYTMPIFISLLGGYVLATLFVSFII